MSKRAPYKLLVSHDSEPSEIQGYPARMLIDVLECGHRFGAVFLPKPSRTPYRHEMGADGKPEKTWRRCTKCPREEA